MIIVNNFYPRPPHLYQLLSRSLFPPPPTTPPPVAFNIVPLSFYQPLPISYPGGVSSTPGIIPNLLLPASSTRLCVPLRLPASAAVSSACVQVSVGPWGVVRRCSLRLLCIPASLPTPLVLRLPSYYGVWFLFLGWTLSRTKARGPGASTPCQSLAPVLALPR